MSAYIVEADTLYRVINLITKIDYVSNSLKPIKEEAIITPQILFNKLNTLNRYAISQRYEAEKMTDKPSYKFNLERYNQVASNTNQYQNFKSLQCFHYQCSEGEAMKADLYKALDKFERSFAIQIISSVKQYDQSTWS